MIAVADLGGTSGLSGGRAVPIVVRMSEPAQTPHPTTSEVQMAEVAAAIALTADLAIGQPLGHMLR